MKIKFFRQYLYNYDRWVILLGAAVNGEIVEDTYPIVFNPAKDGRFKDFIKPYIEAFKVSVNSQLKNSL